MGFIWKKYIFLMFLLSLVCLPFLYNLAFFLQTNTNNNIEQKQLQNNQNVIVNTSFLANNSEQTEWILSYELLNLSKFKPKDKDISLSVKSIFNEDLFPSINLNETESVLINFPTKKISDIVYNNLDDFYWLEIEGIDINNVSVSKDADIKNLTPIVYDVPQLSLKETIDFDNYLYSLSWSSNLAKNFAWIILPTIDIYSLDNIKNPLYQFAFAKEKQISYHFPNYVYDISNWCWINQPTLSYYFLDANKTFQKAFVNINSLSITTIPPQFNPPKINLSTSFYRKSQQLTFYIIIDDPQHRLLFENSVALNIVISTCYRNLINDENEIVNNITLTNDDFTSLDSNSYQATINTYNLTSLDPNLIWMEESIENLFWHSGILNENETTYVNKFNSINGISKIKGNQYTDFEPLNLILDTTILYDKKQLLLTLNGVDFPFLLDYQLELTIYNFKGKLKTYHFDKTHNSFVFDLKALDKPLFPHTNLNNYFYLVLDSNMNNFYQYNDEFGFEKTTTATLNQTINVEGNLTNIDPNSNLLDYENYIGGITFFTIIFVSSVFIAFLILIILFAVNKLKTIL